jgi:S-adenosyl-L-methionine hydrolase (adenosine-forming)
MPRPVITLTTDFGEGSSYVAQMKGVILTLNPEATLVDITHKVPPQDIRHGAQVLDDVTRRFPSDTIHVAVVDPGVGTERRILYARIGTQNYIAPDNGLLTLVAHRAPPSQTIVLTKRDYWLAEVSSTFHGRDIMAPVAAYLSLGLNPVSLGPPVEDLLKKTWPEAHVEDNRIEGSVVSFDSFGNLITDITIKMLGDLVTSDSVVVHCGEQQIRGIVHTYHGRKPGSLVALVGSTGLLELAIVNGNAAKTTQTEVGSPVIITW